METRHIMFDYEEALSAKKNLLTTEINLLSILKKIKDYKNLRKREFSLKNKLRQLDAFSTSDHAMWVGLQLARAQYELTGEFPKD